MNIAQRRAVLVLNLHRLAGVIDKESDNHLASILGAEIGELVGDLAGLYAAVEAQRSVAFFARTWADSDESDAIGGLTDDYDGVTVAASDLRFHLNDTHGVDTRDLDDFVLGTVHGEAHGV